MISTQRKYPTTMDCTYIQYFTVDDERDGIPQTDAILSVETRINQIGGEMFIKLLTGKSSLHSMISKQTPLALRYKLRDVPREVRM
ncbi:hypothetical protein KUTeg_004326 [Tegillarca granosa]|uniref:Uncharacterized protein n=1 Tax=Tegillarca granosa TaxID=220873 RepID=A0ABQ9FPQ2_TEGGR|nr:hypothetical protein KUTeg_004326 [Tegillarca granosa]